MAGSFTGPSPGAPEGVARVTVEAPIHFPNPALTTDLSRLKTPHHPGPPASTETFDQEQCDLDDPCLAQVLEDPVAPNRPIPTGPAQTSLAWDKPNCPAPPPTFVALDQLSSPCPLPSGPGPGALAGGPHEATGAPTLSAPDTTRISPVLGTPLAHATSGYCSPTEGDCALPSRSRSRRRMRRHPCDKDTSDFPPPACRIRPQQRPARCTPTAGHPWQRGTPVDPAYPATARRPDDCSRRPTRVRVPVRLP